MKLDRAQHLQRKVTSEVCKDWRWTESNIPLRLRRGSESLQILSPSQRSILSNTVKIHMSDSFPQDDRGNLTWIAMEPLPDIHVEVEDPHLSLGAFVKAVEAREDPQGNPLLVEVKFEGKTTKKIENGKVTFEGLSFYSSSIGKNVSLLLIIFRNSGNFYNIFGTFHFVRRLIFRDSHGNY